MRGRLHTFSFGKLKAQAWFQPQRGLPLFSAGGVVFIAVLLAYLFIPVCLPPVSLITSLLTYFVFNLSLSSYFPPLPTALRLSRKARLLSCIQLSYLSPTVFEQLAPSNPPLEALIPFVTCPFRPVLPSWLLSRPVSWLPIISYLREGSVSIYPYFHHHRLLGWYLQEK